MLINGIKISDNVSYILLKVLDEQGPKGLLTQKKLLGKAVFFGSLFDDFLFMEKWEFDAKYDVLPMAPLDPTQTKLATVLREQFKVEDIEKIKDDVYKYTNKGNLVAVISNGTAVLGLGDIGPEASKPVMEGKAVLFKKFANIDVFDIEINETDVDKLVDIIASLEPTFGGINLEDIKAPECFMVEEKLRERMKIPVFHDDQHGTAISRRRDLQWP